MNWQRFGRLGELAGATAGGIQAAVLGVTTRHLIQRTAIVTTFGVRVFAMGAHVKVQSRALLLQTLKDFLVRITTALH
jgi:hypothetical protein